MAVLRNFKQMWPGGVSVLGWKRRRPAAFGGIPAFSAGTNARLWAVPVCRNASKSAPGTDIPGASRAAICRLAERLLTSLDFSNLARKRTIQHSHSKMSK